MSAAATSAVRQAVPADADSLAQLHGAVFARGWQSAEMAAFLSDPCVHTIIAQIGGDQSCAGFVMARQAGSEAEILTIAVDQTLQRQGLGRDLLHAMQRRLADAGASVLFLEVAADNAAARGLYEACGFAQVGTRPAYYRSGNTPVDALTLKCHISEVGDIGPQGT